MKSLFYIYIALTTVVVFAAPQPQNQTQVQPTETPVIYKTWKDQQILEARNTVIRISNKITLSRAGKLTEQEIIKELASTENVTKENTSLQQKTTQLKPIERLENELRVAQENLQVAQELSVEDYFVVYLSRFRSNQEAIQSVASRMSKDEVAELIRAMLNRGEATTTQNGNGRPGPAL